MSKTEILAELPKLSREERREMVKKVHEIDGDDWLDEGELSDAEKALLEARVAEHERNPGAAIPWSEFEVCLNRRLANELPAIRPPGGGRGHRGSGSLV